MQLDLPFTAPPPLLRAAPDTADTIAFVRARRARRYILRVRPDGTVRLTVPRGGSRAEGQRFVERNRPWLERERSRLVQDRTGRWQPGGTVLIGGEPEIIRLEFDGGSWHACYGSRVVSLPGDEVDLEAVIRADLKALATSELVPRLRELAARHGLSVGRITVRNQRSRWGSCSRSGNIAINHRLVQMPRWVQDYVLVHELMHIHQQDHSRRYWRLVEAACPDFRDAERWLRAHGPSLF